MIRKAFVSHSFAVRWLGVKLGKLGRLIDKLQKAVRIDVSAFIIPVVSQYIFLVVRVDSIFNEYFIVHENLGVIEQHTTEPVASCSSKATRNTRFRGLKQQASDPRHDMYRSVLLLLMMRALAILFSLSPRDVAR